VLEKHLEKLFYSPLSYDDMPEAATPIGLVTTLFPHQRKALYWMTSREQPLNVAQALAISDTSASSAGVSAAAPQTTNKAAALSPEETELQRITNSVAKSSASLSFFWKKEVEGPTTLYRNILTNISVRQPPELPRGGILADEMGLGKSLTTISLILADKEKATSSAGGAGSATSTGSKGPTLIVCPLSVLNVWQQQLQSHVAPGALSVYTHHGPGRTTDPKVMCNSNFRHCCLHPGICLMG
jgi:SNF2 family DNA or RNA helicase